MKDPAFLFYPNDWIGGTMHMTFEEKGAYIDLLILQFNTGDFSQEQAKNVLRGSENIWNKIRGKFSEKNGLFFNKRLKSEIIKRVDYSKKQSERVKKRWNKSGIASGNTVVLPKIENENENENISFGKSGNLLQAPYAGNNEKELRNSFSWLEQNCRTWHLAIEQVKKYLDQFISEQRAAENFDNRPIGDLKRHFSNWLKKEITIKKPGEKATVTKLQDKW